MTDPPTTPRLRKRTVLLAGQTVVSVGLIVWLLARYDFARSVHTVAHARVAFLVPGLGCALLVIVTLAVRFAAVLKKGGIALPPREVLAITWIGQFWNFFLPGSTGGDVYRLGTLWAYYPDRKTDAVLAVSIDRLVATLLLALAAGVGAFFVPLSVVRGIGPAWQPGPVAAYAGWSVTALAGLVLVVPGLRRCATGLIARIRDQLRAGRIFWRPDRELLRICGWGLLGHVLNFTVFFCYARSVGLPVSFLQVCAFLPLVLLVLILPISINGHGVREMLLIAFLRFFGIAPDGGNPLTETVLALSIVGLSSDLLLGLAGGAVFMTSRWRSASTVDAPPEPSNNL